MHHRSFARAAARRGAPVWPVAFHAGRPDPGRHRRKRTRHRARLPGRRGRRSPPRRYGQDTRLNLTNLTPGDLARREPDQELPLLLQWLPGVFSYSRRRQRARLHLPEGARLRPAARRRAARRDPPERPRGSPGLVGGSAGPGRRRAGHPGPARDHRLGRRHDRHRRHGRTSRPRRRLPNLRAGSP